MYHADQSQWAMLAQGGVSAGARQNTHRASKDRTPKDRSSKDRTPTEDRTLLLECDPYASPWSNRPPGDVCGGDQHATPYYALRQGRWKLLIGDPGADDNRNPSIGNGFFCTWPLEP